MFSAKKISIQVIIYGLAFAKITANGDTTTKINKVYPKIDKLLTESVEIECPDTSKIVVPSELKIHDVDVKSILCLPKHPSLNQALIYLLKEILNFINDRRMIISSEGDEIVKYLMLEQLPKALPKLIRLLEKMIKLLKQLPETSKYPIPKNLLNIIPREEALSMGIKPGIYCYRFIETDREPINKELIPKMRQVTLSEEDVKLSEEDVKFGSGNEESMTSEPSPKKIKLSEPEESKSEEKPKLNLNEFCISKLWEVLKKLLKTMG